MAPATPKRVRREASSAATTAPTTATATSQSSPTIHASSPTSTPIDGSIGLGGTTTEDPSSSANTTTILIVVIVLCASAIMSAALFYLFDRKKNAQFREACRRDPYLTRKEFARRRKLSAIERLEEEEMQRSIMIRKSLASREPSRQNSCEDLDVSGLRQQHHQPQHERQLSEEWMPRTRSGSETSSSASSARHPYADPHPGMEVEIPLAPYSRTPSPSRTPLVRKAVPPPAVSAMEQVSPPLPSLPKPSDVPVHLS